MTGKQSAAQFSNLIHVSMEMQNIEDSLTEQEKDEDENDFFMKLYNGEIEFDYRDDEKRVVKIRKMKKRFQMWKDC